jgi:hypothetical protein
MHAPYFWLTLHLCGSLLQEAPTSAAEAQQAAACSLLVPSADGGPHPVATTAAHSHYWGQALQYLERATQVHAGKKVSVLYAVERDKLQFRHVAPAVTRQAWRDESHAR